MKRSTLPIILLIEIQAQLFQHIEHPRGVSLSSHVHRCQSEFVFHPDIGAVVDKYSERVGGVRKGCEVGRGELVLR